MKTLDDVKTDMSVLYDQLKGGQCDVKKAKGMACIASVYLRACEIELMWRSK